jgi:GNAT superfamily N-acetyltransferase
VQVLPTMRRQGVGRSLVAAAKHLARGEADGLWSLEPIDLEAGAARFAQACGFSAVRRQQFFQAPVAAIADRLYPMMDLFRARGRIPADVSIMPLAEAPLDEVGWLVSGEFGGGPFRALNTLAARAEQRSISTGDKSQVLVHEGKVAAVILARMDHGVGVVDGRVTAPAFRGGWPGALVLEHLVRRGQAEGAAEFRFHCDDDVIDTLNLARLAGAREIATKGLFYYALSAA